MLTTPFPLPTEVYITHELATRPATTADYLKEKEALQQLAVSMVDRRDAVLPDFVALAMEMTEGISAGISLFEPGLGAGVFRWRHVVGKLAAFDGATTPRDYSPCGVTLDRGGPVLTRHAESLYTWIADAGIVVPEVLLVPLYIGGDSPLGTLWIVSDAEGHFHSGHARVASELATFVGIALRIQQTDQRLTALEEQETLAREMNHRVKNVFALTDSMIRLSSRGEGSREQMASVLSGRLQALADAHGLVLSGMKGSAPSKSSLGELVKTILRPHHDHNGLSRITVDGPEVSCGERTVNAMSLVLHELATNAVKYGSLVSDGGRVDIAWRLVGANFSLTWVERGGVPIDGPPAHYGFGSKLVESTITRQLRGVVAYDWQRDGLTVHVEIPQGSLVD